MKPPFNLSCAFGNGCPYVPRTELTRYHRHRGRRRCLSILHPQCTLLSRCYHPTSHFGGPLMLLLSSKFCGTNLNQEDKILSPPHSFGFTNDYVDSPASDFDNPEYDETETDETEVDATSSQPSGTEDEILSPPDSFGFTNDYVDSPASGFDNPEHDETETDETEVDATSSQPSGTDDNLSPSFEEEELCENIVVGLFYLTELDEEAGKQGLFPVSIFNSLAK